MKLFLINLWYFFPIYTNIFCCPNEQITNLLRLVARSGIVFLTSLLSDVKQKEKLQDVSVNKPGKC